MHFPLFAYTTFFCHPIDVISRLNHYWLLYFHILINFIFLCEFFLYSWMPPSSAPTLFNMFIGKFNYLVILPGPAYICFPCEVWCVSIVWKFSTKAGFNNNFVLLCRNIQRDITTKVCWSWQERPWVHPVRISLCTSVTCVSASYR